MQGVHGQRSRSGVRALRTPHLLRAVRARTQGLSALQAEHTRHSQDIHELISDHTCAYQQERRVINAFYPLDKHKKTGSRETNINIIKLCIYLLCYQLGEAKNNQKSKEKMQAFFVVFHVSLTTE